LLGFKPKSFNNIGLKPTAESMGKGVGYITAMNIIDSLIALFFYATIARIVGTSDVGKIALIFLIISIFNTVTLFSLNSSITWFMSYFLGKGTERKTPDELVRELHEAVKPKLYAYDRYADAYLRTPT